MSQKKVSVSVRSVAIRFKRERKFRFYLFGTERPFRLYPFQTECPFRLRLTGFTLYEIARARARAAGRIHVYIYERAYVRIDMTTSAVLLERAKNSGRDKERSIFCPAHVHQGLQQHGKRPAEVRARTSNGRGSAGLYQEFIKITIIIIKDFACINVQVFR